MKRLLCAIVILCAGNSLYADETVRSLQQTLKQQGCYYGNVTGEKSTETTAAIRRYQIRNGLKVTGALNDETTRLLNASGNLVAVTSQKSSNSVAPQINSNRSDAGSTFSQKLSAHSFSEAAPRGEINPYGAGFSQPTTDRINRRSIAEAQYQLMSRGYYRGRVDGKYGRETAFAVRAFQSGAGLSPTGRLDTETLQALGSSDTDFAYLAPPARSYEVWMPVRKLKNGKWKLKWKKYFGGENADEDRQAHREPSGNFYNED